jgi:hypothetical protein
LPSGSALAHPDCTVPSDAILWAAMKALSMALNRVQGFRFPLAVTYDHSQSRHHLHAPGLTDAWLEPIEIDLSNWDVPATETTVAEHEILEFLRLALLARQRVIVWNA